MNLEIADRGAVLSGSNEAVADVVVSVVIPMLNERNYIQRCLESVFANSFPVERLEVLVVDGNSSDGSDEIVREMMREHHNLTLLQNPKRIASSAMNVGIAAARGRYIVRMDAHSEYPVDYIENCVELLSTTKADNVGGFWETRAGSDTFIGGALALLSRHRFGVGNSSYRLGKGDCVAETVPFGAFRADIFQKIGGFREDLVRHEDFELNRRIARSGGSIYLSSKIRNVYFQRGTLSGFLKKAYSDGYWAGPAWFGYPYSFALRHCVPFFFTSTIVFCLSAGCLVPAFWWVETLLLALYCSLAIGASVQLAFRWGWRYVLVLPVLFLLYHFTYGSGTALGILAVFRRQFSSIVGQRVNR